MRHLEMALPSVMPADGTRPDADTVLRTMFREHYDFIWRTLRRLGVPEGSADDGAQQVFIVASRKLDRIAAGSERPFLVGVALRVASDARRSGARARELQEGSSEAVDRAADDAPLPDEVLER